MMENEEIPSAPATSVIPVARLFDGFKEGKRNNVETGRIKNKSLLKSCKCFGVKERTIEDGKLPPVSCSLPPPPVSLSKKVKIHILEI